MDKLNSLKRSGILTIAGLLIVLFSAGNNGDKKVKILEVTATAYNSVPEQTYGNPEEGAWGDMLDPSIKSIAVSRDLLDLGLTHRTEVEIEGLGNFVVLDKMNKRWEKKIDIFMGKDIQNALEWGVKKVTIKWEVDGIASVKN
jgi:3D (Asp-Asp-Asp) domain-containing protein